MSSSYTRMMRIHIATAIVLQTAENALQPQKQLRRDLETREPSAAQAAGGGGGRTWWSFIANRVARGTPRSSIANRARGAPDRTRTGPLSAYSTRTALDEVC